MQGMTPFGGTPTYAPAADSSDVLQRIERNTADMARWVKILTVMVIVLIVVNVLLFV